MVNSVYIHIPFCKNICSYCNFTKMFYNKDLVTKYLTLLKKEIKSKYQNDIIKTLYIGGGTPSSLNINELKELFEIISIFKMDKDYEFTIEVNVSDVNEELLIFLREYGVNRLSIGVQTVKDKYIKLLERTHNKEDVIESINLCKKYFTNISIDLMYGFQEETLDELKEDLDFIISYDISHISIYSLILEENTKLYINKTNPIDEELESKMYYNIINTLKSRGYNHYEISNFSKDGYESKHNLVYWGNKHYYGFGLSASSYIDNKRYTNTKNLTKYLKGKYEDYVEDLSIDMIMEYEMILGLRKMEGINIDEFKDKYSKSINQVFNIDKLIKDEKLIIKNDYLYINEKYLYISNQILIEFIK